MTVTFVTIVLVAVACLAAGFFIGRFVSAGKVAELTMSRKLEEQKVANLQESLAKAAEQNERKTKDLEALYNRNLEQMRAQQKEIFDQQIKAVTEQLRSSSEEIMMRRQQQLAAANNEQIAAILNPLNANIAQMKEAVESSKLEQSKTMASLQTAINSSFEQARQVGESADRLASALTGENKTQGNFGELKLKELLESMGFTEGLEYETQKTMRDRKGRVVKDEETGSRKVPDVILHFPEHRDMVIDSKMSLTAYAEYQNADGEPQRGEALKRHIASVRNHVKELKSKDYSKYMPKGGARLDFVIMYVYNEGALQLALSNDSTLWRDAYDCGVLITGSQNMYALLRVLEISWKQMRQAENQDRIIAVADEIVSRVQILCERMDKVGDALQTAQTAFDNARNMTLPSGRSIIVSANKLIKFGAHKDSRHASLPAAGEQDLPE